MAILLHDEGANRILANYFSGSTTANPRGYQLGLYTNSNPPVDTDRMINLREAMGGGYSRIALPAGTWSTIDDADIPTVKNIERLFVFTGPLSQYGTITGYFVTDADGYLIYSEHEATPYTPANNGDTLSITPAFMLSKGTPA